MLVLFVQTPPKASGCVLFGTHDISQFVNIPLEYSTNCSALALLLSAFAGARVRWRDKRRGPCPGLRIEYYNIYRHTHTVRAVAGQMWEP